MKKRIRKKEGEKVTFIDALDVIDNEEKAYWLGFTFAGATVDQLDGRVEIISSKMGDAIQFEKFVKFLKIKSKVRYDAKKDYYRVYFKNKRFKAQLFERGYRPLKTNLMRLPS